MNSCINYLYIFNKSTSLYLPAACNVIRHTKQNATRKYFRRFLLRRKAIADAFNYQHVYTYNGTYNQDLPCTVSSESLFSSYSLSASSNSSCVDIVQGSPSSSTHFIVNTYNMQQNINIVIYNKVIITSIQVFSPMHL